MSFQCLSPPSTPGSTNCEEDKLDSMSDPRLAQCKTAAAQIEAALQSHPHAWQNYLQSARSIVAAISSMQSLPTGDWSYVVSVLQDLGFADADNGSVTDITNWCQTQWLAILEKRPNSTAALKGLGQYWLQRAQPSLAKIHADERGSSGSSRGSFGEQISEARLHTANYVEARGVLSPASDYFARAVQAAYAESCMTGDLLEKAAEAYMSLGNVSYSRNSQQYFSQALQYLQMTASIPGYQLPEHLQQYLEEYGPLAG
ncbi:hypothetical protein BFW01_g4104 [Lasiodiplodia theobromae]|uniref:Uncharacterized protein n=1 Tax=Lasiodiplodia theobromae TaxID=45133 RepID=A0A5N5D492_9PEZI|nr:uncharacterized protein LTHEOB_12329 [Lasiodiplodia theobromae]KAB2572528.1 hypothetical protein DBV05_g8795 [Lasiodiplodia theobromae]KAF4536017.1 hypothetical protein LTHEOB_12329 [Lasiodiplodia theobromae]KAF9633210.1 hypothetical protein BFW01_g4104 [Lasiodiplodia theobromae]